jgi:hypothetical protein
MADRPDVYINDVSKSVVLEIRAGELQVSDQYPTMYTLRFPRVLKIRYDKCWDEAFTDADLKELIANFQNNRRLMRKDQMALPQIDVKGKVGGGRGEVERDSIEGEGG